ncbi:ImmA/IrrE family metallo-endopeptidase [Methylocapsa acidiphila]|uniref:ImmA/IrrE family metallo-endopeptidase n=1 Tax=Methylocapsa acidiphila TaxID=133552 RepID=UPI0004275FE0|nr:ImmA/IrrE family metallo-endopeptidase [Methylocapsa acidiphila]
MREPTSPIAWANFLVTVWGDRFPVDVRTIALEYSKRFPDPIRDVKAAPVGQAFEGALFPLPKSGEWAILYNPEVDVLGRINFTLGHELGHYLNHRHLRAMGFQCSAQAVLGFDADAAARRLEKEADEFASYLLMPITDYRAQIADQIMTLDLLGHCADRYRVSFTAAALKWIQFTEERAVLIYARDGNVLWGRRSDAAKKSGVFFETGMELPGGSLAALGPAAQPGPVGVELGPGVWRRFEPVREMTIFADRYDATISLLILPRKPVFNTGFGEEAVADVLNRFVGRGLSF